MQGVDISKLLKPLWNITICWHYWGMSAILPVFIKLDGLHILIGWFPVMSLVIPHGLSSTWLIAYYVRSNPRSLVNIDTDMINKSISRQISDAFRRKVNHKCWDPYIIHAISLMTFWLQVAYFNVNNNHILITVMGKNDTLFQL